MIILFNSSLKVTLGWRVRCVSVENLVSDANTGLFTYYLLGDLLFNVMICIGILSCPNQISTIPTSLLRIFLSNWEQSVKMYDTLDGKTSDNVTDAHVLLVVCKLWNAQIIQNNYPDAPHLPKDIKINTDFIKYITSTVLQPTISEKKITLDVGLIRLL